MRKWGDLPANIATLMRRDDCLHKTHVIAIILTKLP